MPPIPPSPSPTEAVPTRRIAVVGIGAGDPDHLTLGAVRALNGAHVVFLVDKGQGAADLRRARVELCARVIDPDHPWRLVEAELRGARDRDGGDHLGAIAAWRAERVEAYAQLVRQLAPGETGAFLVWGDPGLYDGTLAILDAVRTQDGAQFTTEVVPGISAPAALAARHGVALNRPGEAIQITTGRRLARDGWPAGVDNVVVLLDTSDALLGLDEDLRVWWGAYLGLPGERLVAGRLGDERERIRCERARGRDRYGWLFDTYLLRRRR
ncbi:MAG: precorrin-6A synthase (deacetylating) [Actinobacteria bacterium]|nr:precorrin-6A synthase (deacetylating) [Actinomycetota bacterium]